MLRSIVGCLSTRSQLPLRVAGVQSPHLRVCTAQFFSNQPTAVDPEDMPYFHHRKGPRYAGYVKFKSPRKRASKLLFELGKEAVEKSKASKPAVFEVEHRVGDAIELEIIEDGGVNSTELKKVRGVVIGKFNKGIDTSVLIRDVVMGTIVERRLPLHSPLVKSVRLIEKGFIKKKRAKLYYLRDRNPNGEFNPSRFSIDFAPKRSHPMYSSDLLLLQNHVSQKERAERIKPLLP
jgi:large subunit ribosomal protein L19